MSTSKIKKGDTVRVIAGKELGKEGKVLSALDISNVVYLHKGQPTKIGFKVEKDENGKVVKKNRVAKKTGDIID